MGLMGEAGGIKYEEMSEQMQEVVGQRAEAYEDKNVQVVDSLEYGGEVHEDVAVAYVGEGTVPQVLYDNVDLEDDGQMVAAGNVAASAVDHALQSLDEEGVPQYVVMEAGTDEVVSEDVQRMRPLGAVNDIADYMKVEEFDDRLEAHVQEMSEALESPEAREFVRESYQDTLEAASEGEVAVLQELGGLEERFEQADEEIIEEVERAASEASVNPETVFADSMSDHATVEMPGRMKF